MSRTSYHTTLKELAHYGLLPPKYEKIIPRTNLFRWRNESMEKFVGSEINKIADKHTDLIQTLNEYPKMFYAYGKLVKTVVSIVGTANDYSKLVRSAKEKVVNAIINAKSQVPIQKAVKLFGISTSTFHTWLSDLHHSCSSSFFKKCTRIYSNQITPMEIKAVRKSLTDIATAHWSIRSVFHNGIRKGAITIGLDTMYRLNRQLGIREKLGRKKKKKKRKIGIRASAPNQIWHTDITVVKTGDGKKHYIYLLIDNFSRKVLSFDIRKKVSGIVTSLLIQKAYEKASLISKELNVKLICDGGPENNNIHVHDFINQSQINIQKLVALKDIDFSNSMVEAVNKTLKYHYLFPDHPENGNQLLQSLNYFVHDFNSIRPSGQLQGLTPDEAYQGIQMPDNFRTNILKQARINRLTYNRENQCKICK